MRSIGSITPLSEQAKRSRCKATPDIPQKESHPDLFAGYTRDAVPVRGVLRGWPLSKEGKNYILPHKPIGLFLIKIASLAEDFSHRKRYSLWAFHFIGDSLFILADSGAALQAP
jgi:hypothetical protein